MGKKEARSILNEMLRRIYEPMKDRECIYRIKYFEIVRHSCPVSNTILTFAPINLN